ncbi:hypothetical protein SKAU_G00309460 [Synaphobranchus kaupii]|uniref:Uncharacterized protein n=1 Tax=Synaphobranchus kaupii TaxID=118154 RepID=A0A9Q1IL40_SYNKA|nr:hypothetical protein SKAU_G00309460 [Synaphobranchus kaupii]
MRPADRAVHHPPCSPLHTRPRPSSGHRGAARTVVSAAVPPRSSPTPDASASTLSTRCQPIRLLRVQRIIASILMCGAVKDPAPAKTL